MKALNKNLIIFIIIYIVAFGFILQYNLRHPVVNDGVYEYRTYQMNINYGWHYKLNSVNSCIIPLWIPAMIQKTTLWDAMTLFRVYPPFFYALMPAFAYLIARRYLNIRYSVIASLVIILSSYILYFPDVGRVGIALGFLSGMIWALLSKRIVLAVLFALLVVFSHYATGVIAIGLIGIVVAVAILWKRLNLKEIVNPYLIVLGTLIISTGIWNFGIAGYSGETMVGAMLRPESEGILSLASRDMVTQEAFGRGLLSNPMPMKIEWFANWLVVGFVTLGLFLLLKNSAIDNQFKVMSLALFLLILATIAIPKLSYYYGTQRVLFTSLIVLAVSFPLAIQWVAKKIRTFPLLLSGGVLTLYGISTSGLIYLPFGLVKTFPVVITLP